MLQSTQQADDRGQRRTTEKRVDTRMRMSARHLLSAFNTTYIIIL